jgi:hypothetical protein
VKSGSTKQTASATTAIPLSNTANPRTHDTDPARRYDQTNIANATADNNTAPPSQ